MTDYTSEAEIRRMAVALKLPPKELERLLQIARINRELAKKPAPPAPEVALIPRQILTFAKPDNPVVFVEPEAVGFVAPHVWCEQCDRRVRRTEATACAKVFCKARPLVLEQEQ